MHLYEKVVVGVPVFTHVAVEGVDVFFVEFFPVFANHSADFVFEFGNVASPFFLCELLMGVFLLKMFL